MQIKVQAKILSNTKNTICLSCLVMKGISEGPVKTDIEFAIGGRIDEKCDFVGKYNRV